MLSLNHLLRASCVTVLVLLVSVPARSDDPPADKDKLIADLEAKLKAISSELDKLKGDKAAPTEVTTNGIPQPWVKSLTWRSIGPCTMGGRITAISVFEADPNIYWAATASGGLIKTENNGVTFVHQFDKENTVSIGDVCVAPSDKNIVWVGTGEANPRNSVSYGDGVYKSTDGGAKWQHMGLRGTYHTGKIVVHPKDANTVYVGALGRCYGPNPDRGVFKTTDGGATWNKVLYFDENTGCIDMMMHPTEPDTLIAALWERKRDGFDSYVGEKAPDGIDGYDPIVKYGPNAGLYKTSDGGKNWKKLTAGLPTVKMGRIGIDWYRKDPKVVYAIIDSENVGKGKVSPYLGFQGEDAEGGGVKLTGIVANTAAAKANLKEGDIIIEAGDKKLEGYQSLVDVVQTKKVGDELKLKVKRGDETLDITAKLDKRPETTAGGGRGGQGGAPLGFGFRPEPVDGGGIRVGAIEAEAANAKAGLKEGDVILAVEGKPLENAMELMRSLANEKQAGDKVKVTILRGEEKKDLTLTLEPFTFGNRGAASASRPYAAQLYGQRENVQDRQGPDGFQTGGVYRSDNTGETWTRVNSINQRPMYFSIIRVDPTDDKRVYVPGLNLYASTDSGKTFKNLGGQRVHSDHHAMWINPKDGRHMLIGTDGGTYVTYDRSEKWEHLAHMALGQFYHVTVDNRRPYNVYGGLQDNGSWGGPSRSLRNAGSSNEDWFLLGGGDGFVCRVDPDDPDLLYFESQDGNVQRRNIRTGERGSVRPRGQNHRFNWNTPFILSAHNPRIVYVGGQSVFRSLKQGADMKAISPEITRTKRGTATALAESPKNPDVLWVGSDDGALWITRDGGQKWDNIYSKLGAPEGRWVSTIEASRFVEGRAYVCLDAHRSDDDKPYCFVTDDFGKTWRNISSNLPAFGSTRCLREDPINQNLLLCGTEFAAFASIDRGGYWTKINNNLPTVAIHELAIHPTAGEVVAATHGRSLWILDITPLRQMKPEIVKAAAHLYAPAPATKWRLEPERDMGFGGTKFFRGTNPTPGAAIYYSLNGKPDKANLKVLDYAGSTITEITVKKEPGLHRAQWNLSRPSLRTAMGIAAGTEAAEEVVRRPGGIFGQAVPPGVYRIVLNVDGQEFSQPLRIEADPNATTNGIATGGGHSDDQPD